MTRSDQGRDEGLEALAFETRAIHVGQEPDPATGAVAVPIYQTSLFVQDDVDRDKGWFYSRTGNPTRAALERCIASLEGAAHGFCYGSGVAAEDAVLRLLRPGDHLVVSRDLYGGTYRLLRRVWEDGGLSFTPADLTDPSAVTAAWRSETRMVWIESPTNPRLQIVDIGAVAALSRERGAIAVVDNTLASPYLQQPLGLGADVVVHSTTKYLGGHSDVIGGWVGTSSDGLAERLGLLQAATGAVPVRPPLPGADGRATRPAYRRGARLRSRARTTHRDRACAGVSRLPSASAGSPRTGRSSTRRAAGTG